MLHKIMENQEQINIKDKIKSLNDELKRLRSELKNQDSYYFNKLTNLNNYLSNNDKYLIGNGACLAKLNFDKKNVYYLYNCKTNKEVYETILKNFTIVDKEKWKNLIDEENIIRNKYSKDIYEIRELMKSLKGIKIDEI